MITTLRADLIRLSTLRSSYFVPVVLLALVGLITAGSLTQAGSSGMTTTTQIREPLTASTGIMCAVGMSLFAALRVGGEYRYGTMTQRLLAVPQRRRLLASILALHGLLALVVSGIGLVVGLAIAYPMLADDDLSMGLSPQILAAVLFSGVAFSLIGVSCAVILRSQTAAVLVIVGTFVGEKLIGIFVGAGLGAAPAAGALTLVALALVVIAAALFTRRDITP